MADQFNTIAGWTLGAGIVALGMTLLTGEYFKHHPVEKGGYPVEATEEGGGGGGAAAEEPIGQRMAKADPAKGEAVFKKCASCHTINAGGANGIGPNLHAVMGKKHGHAAGFAYSPGMLAKAGNWDFVGMDAWLKKPKAYVEGTKMSFGGLGKGQDRADLIAYLNAQGSNLPMPPVEAATAPVADAPAADAKGAPAAETPAAKK
jgi:cytochrome c